MNREKKEENYDEEKEWDSNIHKEKKEKEWNREKKKNEREISNGIGISRKRMKLRKVFEKENAQWENEGNGKYISMAHKDILEKKVECGYNARKKKKDVDILYLFRKRQKKYSWPYSNRTEKNKKKWNLDISEKWKNRKYYSRYQRYDGMVCENFEKHIISPFKTQEKSKKNKKNPEWKHTMNNEEWISISKWGNNESIDSKIKESQWNKERVFWWYFLKEILKSKILYSTIFFRRCIYEKKGGKIEKEKNTKNDKYPFEYLIFEKVREKNKNGMYTENDGIHTLEIQWKKDKYKKKKGDHNRRREKWSHKRKWEPRYRNQTYIEEKPRFYD